jgi:sec-independent protein translocase protein TatB
MFDVSFGELLIIAVVALIVIGPEKLPKVARTLGLLAGRMQRYVSTLKGDIKRELKTDEFRKLQQEVQQGISAIEAGVANKLQQAENTANAVSTELKTSVNEAGKPDR